MSEPAQDRRDYVASLTGLRGIAALFVFIFHYDTFNPGIRLDQAIPFFGTLLQFPLGLGWAGVDLFFVLSGFLLALPFARNRLAGNPPPAIGHYYQRRLLRVFPAYYAQLIILLIGGAWFLTWHPLSFGELFAHVFMFFNVGPSPVRPLVGVWWTLPVEFSFYLLLPLIAWAMRPRPWVALLGVSVLISVVYRWWTVGHLASGGEAFLVASHLPGSLPEFTLGASAAVLVQWMDLSSVRRPAPLMLDMMLIAGLAAAGLWLWFIVLPNGASYWQGHWSMIATPSILGSALALTVISLYWGSKVGRMLFANPVVYFLGLISYSLYLWHFIVLQQAPGLFGESWASLAGFTRFLASLLLVVAISAISYALFERPFFRLRGKRR